MQEERIEVAKHFIALDCTRTLKQMFTTSRDSCNLSNGCCLTVADDLAPFSHPFITFVTLHCHQVAHFCNPDNRDRRRSASLFIKNKKQRNKLPRKNGTLTMETKLFHLIPGARLPVNSVKLNLRLIQDRLAVISLVRSPRK